MAAEQTHTADVVVDGCGCLLSGSQVKDRQAKRHLDKLVAERFRIEFNAWAAAYTGKLRTRLVIRFEIAGEIETLCAALGPWGLVQRSEIIPAEDLWEGERGLSG